MKKIIPAPIFCLVIFLIQGCSAPKKATAVVVPTTIEKERVIHKSFESTWQSTIELLATYNMPIKNLDKSSGFISTEYKLITGNPTQYMVASGASSNFMGKVDLTNYGGNLNVLLKKITEDSTRVCVNVFYTCTANKYKYASLLSSNYVLESSTQIDCATTGNLEKAILDYLANR